MRLLRPTAAVVAVGLLGAGVVTLAPAAAAATAPDTTKLARYLTTQLVGGTHYEPFGAGSSDVGLTIDGALALAATGNPADAVTVGHIAGYLDSSRGADWVDYQGKPQYFDGGGAAKLALLAEVAHRDPRAFAGLDLIHLLDTNVCTAQQSTTDPTNCAGAGNFFHATSVFSQSLGVIAQQRAGTASPAAVRFLLSLQRPDGAFPSLVPNSNDADPDSTGMAVQALALLPAATGGAVKKAITAAIGYLAGSQSTDGSWGPLGSQNVRVHSTNSTALAIQGFAITSTVQAAQATRTAKALAFLGGLQNPDGGLPVDNDRGQPASDVRASTQVLGGVVGVPFGTLTLPAPVTRTPTSNPTAAAAATYLAAALTNGDHVEGAGYVQQGTTADVAFGLLASGGQDRALSKVVAYLTLDTTVRSYVNGSNFGDNADSAYAGATAKLATLLELAGQDPTDVGVNHLDLIAQLKSLQAADGRFHDRSAFGDFANVFGQAFGVLALTGVGDTAAAAKARTALTAAQCTDGGFPEKFDQPTCTSIPDATGLAVQALDAGHTAATRAVTAAAAPAELVKAVGWLTRSQRADGSYAGAPAGTNSTGYAALGLLAVGQNATKPRAYLTGIANADGGLPADATGASNVFATAQALPALAGASLLQVTPAVLRPVDTIVGDDPPPTTPPSSTPPTPPTSTPPTAPGSGAASSTPGSGASGLGGGTSVSGGSLADTGADVVGPLWVAVLALVVGAIAVAAGVHRPRRATHAARRH